MRCCLHPKLGTGGSEVKKKTQNHKKTPILGWGFLSVGPDQSTDHCRLRRGCSIHTTSLLFEEEQLCCEAFLPVCALKSQNSRINKLWQDEMVNEKKLVSGGRGKTNSRLTSHKEPLHASFLPVSREWGGFVDNTWKSGTFPEPHFYCNVLLRGSQQARLIKF